MRNAVLDTKTRIDGRDTTTVRPIVAQVGALPRTHGSALFTRGETQALVVATLGTSDDEQFMDQLEGTIKQNFMLHYNFPPYSVGETGRMGAPSRREIGHGKLAWRAVHPMLPSKEEFPYTIRVVSEITESNGSSSMATVCGTSLALMDAGVPIKKPIAGIAMGLILEGERFAVLSDILGDEDHLGDMDFKVAGTEEGVTSLQMDIKIAGITEEIMKVALDQAKGGRLHILGEMSKAISHSRDQLGEHAPRIETIKIPTDKIREVIGSGGKVIREIVEKTGAKVNIEDDGTVMIASADHESIKAALKWIKGIVAEPEIGEIYDGKVVKVMDFGAFVNFFGPKDGLVHISELAPKRVNKVDRRGAGRPGREGEASGLRRSRQGAPVHEGGGSGDRRRPHQEAASRSAAGRRRAGQLTFCHRHDSRPRERIARAGGFVLGCPGTGEMPCPRSISRTCPCARAPAIPPRSTSPAWNASRQRLGDAGGLTDFGVNLLTLPPGVWSSQRHWHSGEDEFVYVLSGEVVLIDDAGEQVLRAGDCAAFPKGDANGHHLINRSDARPRFLKSAAGRRTMSASIPIST